MNILSEWVDKLKITSAFRSAEKQEAIAVWNRGLVWDDTALKKVFADAQDGKGAFGLVAAGGLYWGVHGQRESDQTKGMANIACTGAYGCLRVLTGALTASSNAACKLAFSFFQKKPPEWRPSSTKATFTGGFLLSSCYEVELLKTRRTA